MQFMKMSQTSGKSMRSLWALMVIINLHLMSLPAEALWKWATQATFRGQYDVLNEYLLKKVQTEDAYDNLMQVEDTLGDLFGNATLEELRAKKDLSKLEEAMVQFASLGELVYPEIKYCDQVGQQILYKNVLASGEEIMVPEEELGPLRRIAQVIRQVAVDHADNCRRAYPKNFKIAREAGIMNDPVYDYIRKMIDAVIATSPRRAILNVGQKLDDRTMFKRKALGVTDMSQMRQAEAILFFVRARGSDDPDTKYTYRMSDPRRRNKWIVDETKLRQVLQKYVFGKCEVLEKNLGHILRPATFEQQLYSESMKYRAVNEHVGELMVWIEYYRLCQRMLIEDKETLIKNIISFIWKIG